MQRTSFVRLGFLRTAFFAICTAAIPLAVADIPTDVKPVSLNLGGFNYYSAGPFANTLLTGGEWLEYGTDWGTPVYFRNTDGTANPQFNAKGLPNYLNTGKKLRILLWPYGGNKSTDPVTWPKRANTGVGKWVVTWQGNADVRLNGATFIAGESSGAATGSLLNGRRVYNMPAVNVNGQLTIEAVTTPLTDLKVWLPDPANPQNQSLENSGAFWHPTFLATVNSADFNHLRFMDWGETNSSPQQDWADRRLPTFVLQHGVLNRRSPVPTSTNFAGNRKTGIAYEHMVALCNATNKNMWICVPHLATDAYVTNLANLLRYGSDGVNPYTSTQANPVYPSLNTNLKVWVEYSNEIWSSGNNFAQGNWALGQGTALGFTTDPKARFNGRRYAEIWRLFQQRFGGSSRLVRVAGLWSGGTTVYSIPFLTELKAYGATLSPVVSVDAVALTTYFGNGIQDWAYEQANLTRGTSDQWFHTASDFVYDAATGFTWPVSVVWTDSYWSPSNLANQHNATFAEWKKRIFSGSTAQGGGPDSTGAGGGFDDSLRTDIFNIFGQHLPIVAYEGGPSLYSHYLDGGDVRDDGITNFLVTLNRNAQFADIYRIQLNMAKSKGLSSSSLFVDVSLWGKNGQWGHLEYMSQPFAQSPKWTGIMNWATDMANIRNVTQPIGTRPTFATSGNLALGHYLTPYLQEIEVAGGNYTTGATPQFAVIGSLLSSGLALSPVSGNPSRYRVSGTPTSGGWNYFYLRVNDSDGDASWKIFSFYVTGGPGTLVEADLRGTFSGAGSLPKTTAYTIDPAITWSGIHRGAAYMSSGGSAIGTDGTGVDVLADTDAIRFRVSQGTSSEASSTLASAITDNEYLKFALTPQSGNPLNLRKAEVRLNWVREEGHAPRNLAVMTSVGGFSASNAIYTLTTMPALGSVTEHVFRLPDTTAYTNLTTPVEFRVYFHGSQYSHKARLLGLKITRDPATIPAQITSSPASQTVHAGADVTFTVSATGAGPLSYQWKRGTTNIGTNSATLTLTNVQAADAGSYTVTVTNSFSTATSAAATLTVNTPPPAGGYVTAVESNFTGTNPGLSLPWMSSATLASGLTYSGWSKGTGVTGAAGNNHLQFYQTMPAAEVDATLALAISQNQYLSVSVGAASGTLDLRSADITFGMRRIDFHAPRRFAVLTSVGGFTTGAVVFDTGRFTTTTSEVFAFQLPDTSAYAAVSGPVEIRIYGYAGQYGGHDAALESFKLSLLPAGGSLVAFGTFDPDQATVLQDMTNPYTLGTGPANIWLGRVGALASQTTTYQTEGSGNRYLTVGTSTSSPGAFQVIAWPGSGTKQVSFSYRGTNAKVRIYRGTTGSTINKFDGANTLTLIQELSNPSATTWTSASHNVTLSGTNNYLVIQLRAGDFDNVVVTP